MQKPEPEQLKALALFGGISDEALGRFADTADVVDIAPGQCVFVEGDAARSLFVVAAGRLAVVKSCDDGERSLNDIGPGDFFGEMSFVDMQPRSATVRAMERTILWAWPYSTLGETYRKDGKTYTLLVMNIARELSRRLRRADQMLTGRQPD